ncbi:MAG: protein kinase [Polyangiales bacterium]
MTDVSSCRRCGAALTKDARFCAQCGASAQASTDDRIGGRYEYVRELGRGAMGKVIEAQDVNLGRRVAVKLLNRSTVDADAAETLRHEASLLAAIRHPNVVTVYEYGLHDGAPYIVMELVEGMSLHRVIEEHAAHGAQVPIERAWTIIERVGAGLQASHEVGVVHRDVKPSNIMIEHRTGRAVLIDFGIAARGRADTTVIAGTPVFMAPEDFFGSDTTIGPTSDHYAFAVTAYELMTGVSPFDEADINSLVHQKLRGTWRAVSAADARLAPLDEVFRRALSGLVDQRYPSIQSFIDALREALRSMDRARVTLERPSFRKPGPTDVLDILAVDDDDTFRRLAMRAAQIAFYGRKVQTRGAATGADALELAKEAPALLLLDYDLPGLNGIETLARLRARPGGESMRVVVVSGRAGEQERWRFNVLGVQDFVRKPVEFGALVQALSDVAAGMGWTAEVPVSSESTGG